jgi:hypothetical protein
VQEPGYFGGDPDNPHCHGKIAILDDTGFILYNAFMRL